MTSPTALAVSSGLGLLMAAIAGGGAHATAAAAAIAVAAGVLFRPAATLAVLLSVAALALGGATPAAAAGCGLAGAGYLVVRHTNTVTAPTIVAAVGFTFVGLLATAVGLQLPWLPVLAPVAAFACYALVTSPFLPAGAVRPKQPR